jgi:cell division protein FtsI (penicillin-binding protein 3)
MKRTTTKKATLNERLGSLSAIRRARKQAKSEKKPRVVRRKLVSRAPRKVAAKRSFSNPAISILAWWKSRPVPPPLPEENAPPAWRILLALGVLGMLTMIVVGRAAQLQLIEGRTYATVAERQATTSSRIRAKRGVIKDRHGAELAITVDVDSVYAEPRRIEDRAGAIAKLSKILKEKPAKLEKKLNSDRAFVYLKRKVDPATAEAVRALGITGLATAPEPKRFYTNVSLAAHVLGFTGSEGQGQAGVERYFDESLEGKVVEAEAMRDALGRSVATEAYVPDRALEGADVTLTLDREIQHTAETALKATVEKYQAKGAVAIVLEPKSGDVLALASYPTFNPNNLGGATPDHQLNRAISQVVEPGSTMKMVTIAAALEEGLIKPDDKVDCEGGKWKIGGRTIGDANHKYGELTVAEVMKVSSNICAAKIGMELGAERLHDWLFRFGFGAPTGVELPGEIRGLIRPASNWRTIALANIAFGQGISVTPMQVAQAASVIANDGLLVAPRLILGVEGKNGERHASTPEAGVRVISAKTAADVRRMMIEVTAEGGTALGARIPGFSVAGKTGTAQKIDPVTKAYSHELYISSFVGFVPADRPEVAILVMIDEPKGAYYGGVVAAPAFREIAIAALSSREVFPEDQAGKDAFLTAHRTPPPPVAAVAEVNDHEGLAAGSPLDGALSVEAQTLLGLEADKKPVAILTGGTAPTGQKMPNFAGLELHEVLNRSAEVRCDPVVEGSGRVVSQIPVAGAPLAPGARCELRLAPRG